MRIYIGFFNIYFFFYLKCRFISAILPLFLSLRQYLYLRDKQHLAATLSVWQISHSQKPLAAFSRAVQSSLNPPSRGKVSVSLLHRSIHPHSPWSALFTLSNNPPRSTESPGHSFLPGTNPSTRQPSHSFWVYILLKTDSQMTFYSSWKTAALNEITRLNKLPTIREKRKHFLQREN